MSYLPNWIWHIKPNCKTTGKSPNTSISKKDKPGLENRPGDWSGANVRVDWGAPKGGGAVTGVVTVGVVGLYVDWEREETNEGGEVDDASQEPCATFVNGLLSGLELNNICK